MSRTYDARVSASPRSTGADAPGAADEGLGRSHPPATPSATPAHAQRREEGSTASCHGAREVAMPVTQRVGQNAGGSARPGTRREPAEHQAPPPGADGNHVEHAIPRLMAAPSCRSSEGGAGVSVKMQSTSSNIPRGTPRQSRNGPPREAGRGPTASAPAIGSVVVAYGSQSSNHVRTGAAPLSPSPQVSAIVPSFSAAMYANKSQSWHRRQTGSSPPASANRTPPDRVTGARDGDPPARPPRNVSGTDITSGP